MSNSLEFDSPPTEAQLQRIASLSATDLADIDAALLALCIPQWRTLARVVGGAMLSFEGRFNGVPDTYFAQRVARLIDEGVLEVTGDPRRMRGCEIRRVS
jgi:hypothetical protein